MRASLPEARNEPSRPTGAGLAAQSSATIVWGFRAASANPKGTLMKFDTKRITSAPDAIAPDGSEVRVLCQLPRGGLAVFSLASKAVSKAVAHRTIEEVWYFTAGCGRMWRKLGDHEDIVEVGSGISISIPTGTHFQFRCDSAEPLVAIGVTMPPWPGEGEAFFVEGKWRPTV
jgi:mannose-6-phosphate isomerase-like protein (cupin superfamily)